VGQAEVKQSEDIHAQEVAMRVAYARSERCPDSSPEYRLIDKLEIDLELYRFGQVTTNSSDSDTTTGRKVESERFGNVQVKQSPVRAGIDDSGHFNAGARARKNGDVYSRHPSLVREFELQI
jgi:hypothetical protein